MAMPTRLYFHPNFTYSFVKYSYAYRVHTETNKPIPIICLIRVIVLL